MPIKEESTIKLGQVLLLYLKNKKLVYGELMLAKETHLRLKEAKDFKTNKVLGRGNVYYVNEIDKVRIIPKTLNNDCSFESEVEDKSSSDESMDSETIKPNPFDSTRYHVGLPQKKLESLINNVNSYEYISRYDKKYWDAIKHLRTQKVLAVNVENVKHGRKSCGSIISVATETKIFLFDLIILRQPPKELKQILETADIMKIFHYAEKQLDYLKHVYNIHVRNFFDTMMAYMFVSNTKEIVPVEHLIEIMFKLPITPDTSTQWMIRPLSEEGMIRASANVGFLIEIQENLIHKHMLKNFYDVSRKVMYEMCNNEDISFKSKPVKAFDVKEVDFKYARVSLDYDSSFNSNTSA